MATSKRVLSSGLDRRGGYSGGRSASSMKPPKKVASAAFKAAKAAKNIDKR